MPAPPLNSSALSVLGNVALVTGGSRGIGAGIALELAASGMDVAIASLDARDVATEVMREIERLGRRVLYLQADIAQVDHHDALISQVEDALGSISCLVNNAGVTSMRRASMLDLTPESFDRTLGINLRAAFFLTQRVALRMRDRPQSGYRSIINISSVNADVLGPDRADYCISKAGLSMMSKLFAAELAQFGIHVFEVRPGIIRTLMTRPATEKYDALIEAGGVPMGRWGQPSDVGASVAALARGAFPFSTGEVINVGGGLQLHRL